MMKLSVDFLNTVNVIYVIYDVGLFFLELTFNNIEYFSHCNSIKGYITRSKIKKDFSIVPFFHMKMKNLSFGPVFQQNQEYFLRKETMFLFNVTLFLMFVSFNATTFYNSRTELEKVDHAFREVDDINKKKQVSEEFSSQIQCTNTCNINI